MLIALSEILETPVSTLLGETVAEAEADALKTISQKLEAINLQLAQRKTAGRKIARCFFIAVCAMIAAASALLVLLKSPYLGWNYGDPETAVLGTAFHSLEWLFVRTAPVILTGAVAGILFTRSKE